MAQGTHSPDPNHIGNGAGLADHVNGGYHPAIPATGATAGIPGSFTPAGATPPANVVAMVGIVANPVTPWTSGQYVQTQTAGAAGRSSWSGTDWVGGAAPLSADSDDHEKREPQRETVKIPVKSSTEGK